jgi:hypothetical protein
MPNYLLPARSSDEESTRLSKSLLAMFSIGDNIESLDAPSLLIPTFLLEFVLDDLVISLPLN